MLDFYPVPGWGSAPSCRESRRERNSSQYRHRIKIGLPCFALLLPCLADWQQHLRRIRSVAEPCDVIALFLLIKSCKSYRLALRRAGLCDVTLTGAHAYGGRPLHMGALSSRSAGSIHHVMRSFSAKKWPKNAKNCHII